MGKEQRGAAERREGERVGYRRESKREQERLGGREWERDPQSKRRGLTGAKGGWWVRADQGVWDAKTARNSQVVKKRGEGSGGMGHQAYLSVYKVIGYREDMCYACHVFAYTYYRHHCSWFLSSI